MCVVSMAMDHFYDKWRDRPPYPWPHPYHPAPTPALPDATPYIQPTKPAITPDEIDEFRKLLDRAREYDKRNNEPDCELEDKKRRVKALAQQLGVEIDFL